MSKIKDAVLALTQGNSAEFTNIVKNELTTRAMEAIEAERIFAGQKFFDDVSGAADENV